MRARREASAAEKPRSSNARVNKSSAKRSDRATETAARSSIAGQMRLLFEELIPRLKTLELASEPQLSQATFVNGPKKPPFRYRSG